MVYKYNCSRWNTFHRKTFLARLQEHLGNSMGTIRPITNPSFSAVSNHCRECDHSMRTSGFSIIESRYDITYTTRNGINAYQTHFTFTRCWHSATYTIIHAVGCVNSAMRCTLELVFIAFFVFFVSWLRPFGIPTVYLIEFLEAASCFVKNVFKTPTNEGNSVFWNAYG